MSSASFSLSQLFETVLGFARSEAPAPETPAHTAKAPTNVAGKQMPEFGESPQTPPKLTRVEHPDGRMSQYPPTDRWEDWVEYDGKLWPRRVARRYTLVPTICFNCESACGLLAYVDRETLEIRKFEGNPVHPGSRGRNCAKGPATHNQIYDPERILYPLKRVGERGAGQWKRISWEQALDEISAKMRASREKRNDGIMYHVGRPGEDHYTNRVIQSWGVDGHNSHTNICSSAARCGYYLWSAGDRPSPDHANARCILLVSSHLETGHYFNPHAQRIIEAKMNGAKIVTFDPRLSNTAAKSDVWLPTWPGSETTLLLTICNALIQDDSYAKDFVRRWVNWDTFLREFQPIAQATDLLDDEQKAELDACLNHSDLQFEDFDRALKVLYRGFTPERAAAECQVPIERIHETIRYVKQAIPGRVAGHVWRSASMGNKGGWQVSRCLFFVSVLTGSVGTEGGTSLNSWNKFVPKPYKKPPAFNAWQDLHLPDEYPFAFYEMSFLLPHFLEEGRGDVDVYFSRVYNPMWINPDGFMWLKSLRNTEQIKCHVALTPTWNESAWFADYVLPMGHAGERHDLMSQETHSGMWIGFRQPVRRVAMERLGQPVERTHQANPGEVWEENEFWVDLTWKMDPDGSMGIREWVESIQKPGTPVTQDEYWAWVFEHSVPGLPEAAQAEGLTPLAYMRKYGCFEVVKTNYLPYEAELPVDGPGGVLLEDGTRRVGFGTPSGKLEFFSPTMRDWGWSELDRVLPWWLESHVDPKHIDRDAGEMILLPNFRLPTLIHTRSANCKWLYEISHANPIWMNPLDAQRIGVRNGELVRVETRIGWFVDKVWVTEGIKPGIIAMSHHLGRWRLQDDLGGPKGTTALARLGEQGSTHTLTMTKGAGPWSSPDPDTERIWWKDVGVHQNLTHAVQPDPVAGHHCWLQKALSVRRAQPGEKHGMVSVDVDKSMAVYREWIAQTRPASTHSPDGTRRPYWLKRPLKPVREAYTLPDKD